MSPLPVGDSETDQNVQPTKERHGKLEVGEGIIPKGQKSGPKDTSTTPHPTQGAHPCQNTSADAGGAVSLLDIYPEKAMIQKDTRTPVFIIALFTTAKSWGQPKCPLTGEWIKKMQYIYIMAYYSAIERDAIGSFVETWMDLETVTQSKVSQKEKNKYRILMHICGI